jgi:hypothetical protein
MLLIDVEANYWASVTAWATWFAAFGTIGALVVALWLGFRERWVKPNLKLMPMSFHGSETSVSLYHPINGWVEEQGLMYLILVRCTSTERSFIVKDCTASILFEDSTRVIATPSNTSILMKEGTQYAIPFERRLLPGVVISQDTASLYYLQFLVPNMTGKRFEKIDIQITDYHKGKTSLSLQRNEFDIYTSLSITDYMIKVKAQPGETSD